MIDILFIAFQYPPINVGGSIRPYMFSKYLPQFNIKPIVLTLDPKSQDEYIVDQNNQLINKLPPEVIIHPIPLKKKNKKFFHKFNQIYLSIGDDKNKRWKTNVLIKIEELLSQNNIKAIYFTAPPFSNGNLAVEIAKS